MVETLMAIKEAAGHSRVTTTEGYIHIKADTTYEAVNHIANQIYQQ